MTCDELEQILHPYLDGELDQAAERSDIERHLTTCPACDRRVRAERQFKATMKAALAPLAAMPAPAALRQRITHGFRARERRRVAVRIAGASVATAAAALVCAVTYSGYRSHQRSLQVEGAASHHAKHFPLDIGSVPAQDIEAYVESKLGHRVALPAMRNAAPAGARLISIQDKTAAYIRYDGNTPTGSAPGRVGLVVVEDEDTPAELEEEISHGYNVVTWGKDKITYIVVSDPTDDDVRSMLPQAPARPTVEIAPVTYQH